MSLRTIIEITCVCGFSFYVLWSWDVILTLAKRVCVRDEVIAGQKKIVEDSRNYVAKVRTDVAAWQNEIRKESDVMMAKIAAMRSQQLNGKAS